MSVKTDASGRRSVQLEFEVPGTPEQVWQAIATGPGISSWFVPAEVEEREGGAVTFHLGVMDSSGIVTAWEPPRRFAYEERDWAESAPPLATECLVEARSGGTCVVRLVHSLFASGDEWDDQMESFEAGWPPFFDVLRLVLAHFVGQPAASFRVMKAAGRPEPEAWAALAQGLGLESAARGERRKAASAPPFAGVVERGAGEGKNAHELLLRLDEPVPGVALIGAYTWGGETWAMLSLYLFGDRARGVAGRDEPLWNAWVSELFAPAEVAAKELS